MFKIKVNSKIEFKLFEPVNIKLLVKLSDIDSEYESYPDENLEPGAVMQIIYTPGGLGIEYGGRCYLSDNINDQDINMIEGVDFEFV